MQYVKHHKHLIVIRPIIIKTQKTVLGPWQLTANKLAANQMRPIAWKERS